VADDLSRQRLAQVVLDAPLNKDERVDWTKARDWLIAEYGAAFSKAWMCPVSGVWTADFTCRTSAGDASAQLYADDFPDDLNVRVKDPSSEHLIHDVAARLLATRPDLGDMKSMDVRTFGVWMKSLGGLEDLKREKNGQ